LPDDGFPFDKRNNINGIDAGGTTARTLHNPDVTAVQEAYVRQVIDTVNDLDNVLYEIANECEGSTENAEWQYHLINYIHAYERSKPKQHPVVMTVAYPQGSNAVLFNSPAEAISPNAEGGYKDNPPAADGSKVIISDTDHLWGVGADQGWVWKSFTRGLNPIFMDPYKAEGSQDHPSRSKWEAVRRSMGYTRTYAQRINLAVMVPRGDLASTGYCLANPGEEYLVYLPADPHWLASWMGSARFFWRLKPWLEPWLHSACGWGRQSVTVDLSAVAGELAVEWFNPSPGEAIVTAPISGGIAHTFTAPFRGDAVLYLRHVSSPPTFQDGSAQRREPASSAIQHAISKPPSQTEKAI
jgi:hypothetical protein